MEYLGHFVRSRTKSKKPGGAQPTATSNGVTAGGGQSRHQRQKSAPRPKGRRQEASSSPEAPPGVCPSRSREER